MEQIGYSLLDANGAEIQHWGDTPGVCVGIPSMVRLPNGDDVHGASVGPLQDWALVPRFVDYRQSAAEPAVEGGNVVVALALTDLKAKLFAQVNADAETVRLRYITPGVGQSMTYLEKHNQAVAVEGLGEEAANALSEQDRTSQFPTLSASVGIEAATLWDCAQIVVQTYEAWAALSNQIERTRLMGKRAISLASDAAAARAAYEAITWPQ